MRTGGAEVRAAGVGEAGGLEQLVQPRRVCRGELRHGRAALKVALHLLDQPPCGTNRFDSLRLSRGCMRVHA